MLTPHLGESRINRVPDDGGFAQLSVETGVNPTALVVEAPRTERPVSGWHERLGNCSLGLAWSSEGVSMSLSGVLNHSKYI